MPRVAKCRRVCAEPLNRSFTPQRNTRRTTCITVEELEALRLCDLEGFDQETAAKQMDVSRGTFQPVSYTHLKTGGIFCGKEQKPPCYPAKDGD